MSYNVTETVINDKQTFISAGISELTLSHRVAISSKGNPYFEYTYTNDSGKRAYKTEWPVNDPKPFHERNERQKEYIMTRIEKAKASGIELSTEKVIEQMHNWDINAQMKRILYVAKQFVPAEELIGDFTGFEQFIRFISDKIGGNEETDEKGTVRRTRPELLRVKLVWDHKDEFITTPSKVLEAEPWLERADLITSEDSKIVILNTDKITKSNNAYNSGTRAPQTANPLATGGGSEKDDMPF